MNGRRTLLLSLGAATFVAGGAHAQQSSRPGLWFTPVVGYQTGYRAEGDVRLGSTPVGSFREKISGGPALGGMVRLEASSRFSLRAGATRVLTGGRVNTLVDPDGQAEVSRNDANQQADMWLIDAAVGFRPLRALPLSAYAGPAWVRRDGNYARKADSHAALLVGADAQVPLTASTALYLGVEDHVTSWSTRLFAERRRESWGDGAPLPEYQMPNSHIPSLRMGVSVRIH